MLPERTKIVTLTFLRDELLNDIAQYGFVEGDVQRADADHLKEGKHQTQDVTQDGNIELVTRHLDLALSYCREALYPYTKRTVDDGVVLDDTLQATGTYVIELLLPDDYSQSTVVYLEQLIHNLLVYYVLWMWLGITKPEAADKWLSKYTALVDEIKGTLARRVGRVRRPVTPFS